MAVLKREVKNKRNSEGVLTGRTGVVFDVDVKYKLDGKWKTYSKKGFLTKKEAELHEAEMIIKLSNPAFSAASVVQGKQTLQEFLEDWFPKHSKSNLRDSTAAGYGKAIA